MRQGDSILPDEEDLILDLLIIKEQYEAYFRSLEQPDNKAMASYAGLIKTTFDLMKKLSPDAQRFDPEEMKRLADEILEADYGVRRDKL